MSSRRERRPSTFFSRKVYWTVVPFLALALAISTGIAGIPGIFILNKALGPGHEREVFGTYGIIALATIFVESLFFWGGIYLIWRLLKRITSLTDEMQMLTRSVLHDISTPVAHIQHQADRLGETGTDAAAVKDEITSSCSRILKIVRLSAEISRTYEALDRSGAETVDFSAVVMDTCDIFGAAAADKGVSLTRSLPEQPVMMTAHTYRLQRLVGNLVDNAVKFTPTGGHIEVRLEKTDSGIRLTVSDTGIGMTKEEKARAYERFYRSDKSRHTPGFGLGLSLVDAIVAFYNGKIEIESTPNGGTTFTITFTL